MQKGLPFRSFLAEGGSALIFLLVGIVVLAAVGGAFYLGRSTLLRQDSAGQTTSKPSPTPAVNTPQSASTTDETANWKTYASSDFKFKYPTNWDLDNCGPSTNIYLDNEVVYCQGGLSDISIIRIDRTSDKELSYHKSGSTVVEEKTISLGGKDVVQVDFISNDTGRDKRPYTVTQIINDDLNGDIIYYVTFYPDGSSETSTSNRNIYDQLLRAFKYFGAD